VTVEQVDRFRNKARLGQLAVKLGIPAPATTVVSRVPGTAEDLLADVSLPRFVKPSYSVVVRGDELLSARVARAERAEQLDQAIHDIVGFTDALVQEPVPGVGLGVHVLCDAGDVVSEVHQLRLHEPPGGGGGTLRTTIAVVPDASEYARSLMSEVGWTGPAMVELRFDQTTGEVCVIEVNCRFWGSLPLTLHAGMDFPRWEVDRLVQGRYSDEARRARPRIGVLQRNLRSDLGWRRAAGSTSPRDRPTEPVVTSTWKAQLDVERLDDPGPILDECRDWIEAAARSQLRRAAVGAWRASPPMRRRWTRLVGDDFVRDHDITRWLFVCRGNVGRSPVAAQWWNLHGPGEARSAGTLAGKGRVPSLAWRKVALDHGGVDLAEHRSADLIPDLIEWSQLVVVMDLGVLYDVARAQRRLNTRRPVLLLNADSADAGIPDPGHHGRNDMDRICTQLIDSLERLAGNARSLRPAP
jgi:protein-tyrosine-phosphatase